VGDLLDDNEGGHEECSKSETNDDSTNDEDCKSVPLSEDISRHTSIAIDAGNTGDTSNNGSDDKTVSVD
jgi:hypothetical protein